MTGMPRRVDPLALVGTLVALFLAVASEPWWTISGAATNKLFSIQVSPYYFQTTVVGLVPNGSFLTTLGSLTRLVSILGVIALAASSIRRYAWWRPLAITFSICSLLQLYVSFLLMHIAAETALLGLYGVIPPYSGTSYLPANIVGVDLSSYLNPPVTASFTLPFYLGFLGLGLVGAAIIAKLFRERRKRIEQKGVQAIFTS